MTKADKVLEGSGIPGEKKTAASAVKVLDAVGSKLDSLRTMYISKVAGKKGAALRNLGVDASIKKSSAQVDSLVKAVDDGFEDLEAALADMANAIHTYHL